MWAVRVGPMRSRARPMGSRHRVSVMRSTVVSRGGVALFAGGNGSGLPGGGRAPPSERVGRAERAGAGRVRVRQVPGQWSGQNSAVIAVPPPINSPVVRIPSSSTAASVTSCRWGPWSSSPHTSHQPCRSPAGAGRPGLAADRGSSRSPGSEAARWASGGVGRGRRDAVTTDRDGGTRSEDTRTTGSGRPQGVPMSATQVGGLVWER